ncbi:hypothetical protein B0H34DRAFT_686464 [Crassisporium funariophilum]|nr:hypothetical protein B0H34DRAFT_686464 [Crassisporium funariophilum]
MYIGIRGEKRRPVNYTTNRRIDGIPDEVKSVIWANGDVTVLPYISLGKGLEGNVVQQTAHEDNRDVFSYYTDRKVMEDMEPYLETFQMELAAGKWVVIHNHPYKEVNLEQGNIKRMYQLLGMRKVDVHDAEARTVNWSTPQKPMSLDDFLKNIGRTAYSGHTRSSHSVHGASQNNQMGNVSNRHIITLQTQNRALNNGWNIGWNHVLNGLAKREEIPAEVINARLWILLHQSMYLCHAHHDAGRAAVFIHVVEGAKNWTVSKVQALVNAKDCRQAHKALEVFHAWDLETDNVTVLYPHLKQAKRCIIFAQAGDLIMQPVGGFHNVYTPCNPVTHGGQFLMYDSMHLTEHHGRFITNQQHEAVRGTILCMLVALPELQYRGKRDTGHASSSHQTHAEIPRKALTVMCYMVLHPTEYMSPGNNLEKQPELKRLQKAIDKIVTPLKTQKKGMEKYISDNGKGKKVARNPKKQGACATDKEEAVYLAMQFREQYGLNMELWKIDRHGKFFKTDKDGDYLFSDLPWMGIERALETLDVNPLPF